MNRPSRGKSASRRRPSGSWRRRDWGVMFGRTVIAVAAVVGLFALGTADRPTYGPPKAPHGPYAAHPANDVDRLTHDVRLAWEIDQAEQNGWGAD